MPLSRKSLSTSDSRLSSIEEELLESKQDHINEREISPKKVMPLDVADSVLEAVQEAQPFEEMADALEHNKHTGLSQFGSHKVLNDIYGNPISDPDLSNPTRMRDERPLDTIRGFEYLIYRNESMKTRLESPTLGFKVRPDYPASKVFGNHIHYEVQSNGNDTIQTHIASYGNRNGS